MDEARRSAGGVLIRILVLTLVILAAATPIGAASARLPDDAGRTLLRATADSWEPGDRVLVTSPEPYHVGLPGWYDSIESDSVIRVRFSRSSEPSPVRLSQIGALSERIGSKRHQRQGVLAGLVLGLWVGAFLEAAVEDDPDAFINGPNRPYIPLGAVAGILAGAAIGSAKISDVWHVVARFD